MTEPVALSKYNRRGWLALLLLLALAACANSRGLFTRAQVADANSIKAERSLKAASPTAEKWPDERWWLQFGDAQLNALVEEALANSPSLRVARARVDKANALVVSANAARNVQITGSLDSTRELFSKNGIYPPPLAGSWFWLNDLQLNVSYEFDIWDKNRSAYESARGQSKAAQADAYAAALLLSTSVARSYVQLQHGYERRDVADATLKQREQLLELAKTRLSAGLDSRSELKQAETAIPAARQELAQLDETIALARNQLAALLARGPDRGLDIARPAPLSKAAVLVPSNLPVDLIGRRADVAAQRWRVEAALQDTKNARAQFYPDINLAGFIGLQSLGFSNWIKAGSEIAGIGPAIQLPLFDGGRLRGNLAGKNADYDIAVEQYNQTLVDAVHDVADQLASLRAVAAQQRENADGLAHANAIRALALERYRAGLGNYIQVLGTEAQILTQQSAAADLNARELELSIDLVRALGGGYHETPAALSSPPESATGSAS
jgi:NodT family efflux transporter outer membrane factor (OMF) lipoprotein